MTSGYYPSSKWSVRLAWDAEEYAAALSARPSGKNEAYERRMERMFPVQFDNLELRQPCIIVDNKDRILLWYLPRALTEYRQVCCQIYGYWNCSYSSLIIHQNRIWGALTGISKPYAVGPQGSTWRINPENFKPAGSSTPAPGIFNISPAWFQQAHDVGLIDFMFGSS